MKGWDEFMNIKWKILGFHFLDITLIIRFNKVYYWLSLPVNLNFADKLEKFGTFILNFLNLKTFFFRVAGINGSAYLKIDGFL